MVWEYVLIGLVIGIAVGASAVRFGSSKFRRQETLQAELEKSQRELEAYRQELVGHFASSAELLNNMARDYRQLYQHMAKSSNNLLPNLPIQENPFNYRLHEPEEKKDKAPVQMPRDYSDEPSGLFSTEQPK